MEAPRAKRQRQNDFGDKSISQASIQLMLSKLQDGETPSGSKWSLRKQYKERLQHVLHTEALINAEGDPEQWHFCEPGKLMQCRIVSQAHGDLR